MTIKDSVFAAIAVAGGALAKLCGGWDASLKILIAFMAADYATGLIVAGVFKKSGKSESGALESRAGLKGLFRKGAMLAMVFVGFQLDILLGYALIRDAVVIGFVANETISLTENIGLMGVRMPPAIQKAIDVLKSQAEDTEEPK